jgi:tetratricopeptide (TPR) repeat protein
MAKYGPAQRAVRQTVVVVAICAVLVALTWLVFAQTVRHQFVTYDDPQYIYANPDISAGLSLSRVSWAFTHSIAGNWHPLTTISHMMDCQLFGLNPAGHHFNNVLFHTVAVVLLFLVLRQMTGSLWRSAFVAALFAIHPLHVESVAWVSERKDVLSGIFFMLTLGAYTRYARSLSVRSYLLLFLLFACGLMAKAMLVTVPCLLLLLDYWPLARITDARFPQALNQRPKSGSQWNVTRRLISEKVPLLVLSVLSAAVTLFTQFQSTATMSQLPLLWRLNNAVVTYVIYIWQMIWPARLAAFYPHPNGHLHGWQVIPAIAFLIGVTVLAIHWRMQRPYIFTGWFWYVGMLVPVIGLVEAGEQAHADRYTYLPQIGLYVLITWGITDLMKSIVMRRSDSRRPRTHWPSAPRVARKTSARNRGPRSTEPRIAQQALCATIAATIIISLSWRAFVQTSYWRNSQVLWTHALDVTSDNDMAFYNLGHSSLERRQFDKAISRFETALQIRSRNGASHYDFGTALMENNLANLLAAKGRVNEAIDHYHNAMRLRPGYGDPYLNLGNILFQQGRMPDAMDLWQKAHATETKDGRFHTLLADAFLRAGSEKDAIADYEQAIRTSGEDPLPRNTLAWLLATSSDASIRDGNRAVELANEAVRLSRGKDPNYLRTLAAAYAEAGRFSEAKKNAQQALQSAEILGNRSLVNALRDEIALYDLGLPYHR